MIFENKEIGINFTLDDAWKSAPLSMTRWIESGFLSNPTAIAVFKSHYGTIEVVSTDSWEVHSSSLRDKPGYHRASMRERFFMKVLKEFKFKKIQLYAKSGTMPDFHKLVEKAYRKGRNPEKEGLDPEKYVPIYLSFTGDDVTFGNVLAIYQTKSGNKEWTLLSTIGSSNVFIRYIGNMNSTFEDQLKDLLRSIKGKTNHEECQDDFWVC